MSKQALAGPLPPRVCVSSCWAAPSRLCELCASWEQLIPAWKREKQQEVGREAKKKERNQGQVNNSGKNKFVLFVDALSPVE